MSELQVMWWLRRLRGQTKAFTPQTTTRATTTTAAVANSNIVSRSYMVLGHKYPYGVDYGNYMHRIAEEIDAAPTLSLLATSRHPFRALYTYCQGQAYISLFRLQGPYESKDCWNVFFNELYGVCLNRGLLENFGLAVITVLSLCINIVACILECVFALLTLKLPKFFCRYG